MALVELGSMGPSAARSGEQARIRAAVASERKRIERDLHDGAQQGLVNAALMLGLAAKRLRDCGNDEVAELLSESIGALHSSMAELRDFSRGLHPAALDCQGLVPAVEVLAARSAVNATVRATALPPLREPLEVAGYFVVAEALTNVAKHAGAQRVTVEIGCDQDTLSVSVSDDGIGPAALLGRPSGLREGSGLLGLADRVACAGGQMQLVQSPAGGTTVTASFPLAA